MARRSLPSIACQLLSCRKCSTRTPTPALIPSPSSRPRRASKTFLGIGVLAGFGGLGVAAWASQADQSSLLQLKVAWKLPLRLGRDLVTGLTIAADYKYSLWGLEEGTLERDKVKHETHLRCAERLRDLCFKNGGIYIKLGQHIGQLEYLVPQEYVETMRNSMLDRCPVSSYEQVCAVFEAELGQLPNEVFKNFNPSPLASASLAQVHMAYTHGGKKVAVKVQHLHLTETAAVDIATVKFVVSLIHSLFPKFDYRWLVDEVQESLPKELDFILEGKNGERCMQNFRKHSPHLAPFIIAPEIFWDLSTSRVLTMQFIDGVKVTDVNAIKRLGLHPNDVSKLISQTFAEMIFRHGFVHCDPHAANMMVQVAPSKHRGLFAMGKQPQLVLLDHGLYKFLDPSLRRNYAALWKALVFADVDKIKQYSLNLGAGEDLYVLFAGVLTMRPWQKIKQQHIDHLSMAGTDDDRAEIQDCSSGACERNWSSYSLIHTKIRNRLKTTQLEKLVYCRANLRLLRKLKTLAGPMQMYATQYLNQISELLGRLPRVILMLLKTNDCLRAVDLSLGSSVNSFVIIGRESSRAVAELKLAENASFISRLRIAIDMFEVEMRILTFQLLAWLQNIWLFQKCKKSVDIL